MPRVCMYRTLYVLYNTSIAKTPKLKFLTLIFLLRREKKMNSHSLGVKERVDESLTHGNNL